MNEYNIIAKKEETENTNNSLVYINTVNYNTTPNSNNCFFDYNYSVFRPIPPPVIECNINSFNSNHTQHYYFIFSDYNNNCMKRCKTTNKKRNSNSEHFNNKIYTGYMNNDNKSLYTDVTSISTGCVDYMRIMEFYDIDGSRSKMYCILKITTKGIENTISVLVEDINASSTSLLTLLLKHNIVFYERGYKHWCNFISRQINDSKPENGYMDYYFDKHEMLRHINEFDISINASESLKISKIIGLYPYNQLSTLSFQYLTMIIYGIAARLFVVLKYKGITEYSKIAFINPDIRALKSDIKQNYCSKYNKIISIDKNFEKELSKRRNEISILITTDISKATTDKYLGSIACFGENNDDFYQLMSMPLVITDNYDILADNDDYLCLNYELTNIDNLSSIINWGQMQFIKHKEYISEIHHIWSLYTARLEMNIEKTGMRRLLAILLALSEMLLPLLDVKEENLEQIIYQYQEYLVNAATSSENIIINKFKDIIGSKREIPMYARKEHIKMEENALFTGDETIEFTSEMAQYIALKCGTSKLNLIDVLYNDNFLISDKHSKYQRNISIGNGQSKRMYSLDLNKMYHFGEIRPGCRFETKPTPVYRILVGKASDGTGVYFTVGQNNGEQNNCFAYICGKSGMGKSNLCNVLIKGALRQGIPVINIGFKDSTLKFDEISEKIVLNSNDQTECFEVTVEMLFGLIQNSVISENAKNLINTVIEIFKGQSFKSYNECFSIIQSLIKDEQDGCILATFLSIAIENITDSDLMINWSKLDQPGKITQIIVNNNIVADKVLSDFYKYKIKMAENEKVKYTMLFLDEAQDFIWDSNKALVGKILRQGRKFGISGVISTQYLNSDDAKNITSAIGQIGTIFSFKPSDIISSLHTLDLSVKNEDARSALISLDIGEVIAKGNIATDKHPIYYNLKIQILNVNDKSTFQ